MAGLSLRRLSQWIIVVVFLWPLALGVLISRRQWTAAALLTAICLVLNATLYRVMRFLLLDMALLRSVQFLMGDY